MRFSKNQADLQNPCAFQKSGGFTKSWRFTEKQADNRILAGVKIPAPGEKPAGLEKLAACWRQNLQLLTSSWYGCRALVQILVDVLSLSCSPQVRRRLRLPCFYGWTLSPTVPAACTGPTCQSSHRNPKIRQPLEFSLILIKSQKSYSNSASKCPITEPKIRM